MAQAQPNVRGRFQHAVTQARRRKLVIIGTSLAAVVVLLIVVSALVIKPGGSTDGNNNSCYLVEEPPKIETLVPELIQSRDNKVLMRFAGFLTFELAHSTSRGQFNYMYLKPVKLEHSSVVYGTVVQNSITLYTDCAEISLQVDRIDDKTYSVEKLTLNPASSNKKFDTCEADVGSIKFGVWSYYTCHFNRLYRCPMIEGFTSGRFRQVTLFTVVLDLELDGNVANKEFNKMPSPCAN